MPDIEHLRLRYARLFADEPAEQTVVRVIESSLGLCLPDDFKRVSEFFRGGFLGGKSHHAIAVTSRATNIVDDTLRLRMTVDLPPRFVVIAEPAASLIVMECIGKNSRVIWCDASDVRKLSQPQSLRAPQIWSSYSQFFDYLLAEEESERNEST